MQSHVPRSPQQVKNKRNQEKIVNTIQFPETLGNVGTLLLFKKYAYGERETGGAGGVKTVKDAGSASAIVDSIYLPMPEQLLDSTSLKIAGTELGAAGNAFAKISNTFARGDIVNSISNALKNVDTQAVASTMVSKAAKEFLSAVPGLQGAQQGIEAGLGATFNPYAALTFEGVNIKTYTWNWVLSPRTTTETTILQTIIRKLKINSLPNYKNFGKLKGRAFLGYPNVCLPIITGVDTLVMKPTMISNINVDYAGAGELAFLEGGNPAAVKIEITLQEMQIWTREDYDGSKKPEDIGIPNLLNSGHPMGSKN